MAHTAQRYHHGDLRQTLITAATQRMELHGIEGLSLRKLAEEIGVSRTALYHHFKDKNALLCAISAQGFEQWSAMATDIFEQPGATPAARFRDFIHAYIRYAAGHSQMYELMFGRILWQPKNATEDLKTVAYRSFQYQVTMTRHWQQQGLLDSQQDTLRLAQVTWATLHGMAKLLIDGIYTDANNIDAMCDCAANLFIQQGQI